MKRVPLKRRHPGAAAAAAGYTRRLRSEFRHGVLDRDGGCVMCARLTLTDRLALPGDTRTLQAHHVIRAQTMKRAGLPPEAVMHPAAGVALCAHHHAQHHAHADRVPREVLLAATVEFLVALGLRADLDREYPNPQVEPEAQPEGRVEGRREVA